MSTNSNYNVGDVVILTQDREGIIRFKGPVKRHKGTFYGIELTIGDGDCNGTLRKVQYFSCADKKGKFIPIKSIVSKKETNLLNDDNIPPLEDNTNDNNINQKKRKLPELEHNKSNKHTTTNPLKRIKLSINSNTKETKDKDIFNGKDPKSYTVKQLKELCRQNSLKVGGNKTQLIERLSNPQKPNSKSKGGPRLSVQKVHKMLQEQGVNNPESVSNCLKRGIQKGYVIIDSDKGLDKILLQSGCICCSKIHTVRIRDILYQTDYAGLDYEDGGEGAEIQCEECCGLYVTGICEGKPNFDSGKFHNHCTECKGFGMCIHDYREAHCSKCNKHYFQGLSGFGCDNCKRRRMGGFGGFDLYDDDDDDENDCHIQ